MIRCLAGVVLVACALFALPVVAEAELPPGPRLTFLRAGDARSELVNADPAGLDQRVIAGGREDVRPLPLALSSLSWSGDGSAVVFAGASGSPGPVRFDLYLVGADGSGLRRIPGMRDGLDPVFSPDGQTLAFAVRRRRVSPQGGTANIFRSVSTWLFDIDTGEVRQLTPWRNGLYEYPSSFSPDGSILALSRGRERHGVFHSSAVALHLDGSGAAVLAENAGEAVYSPDGSKIAMIVTGRTRTYHSSHGSTEVTPTDIAVADADGSGLTKLTRTKALEVEPSWDPSGQRLAYMQFRASASEADFLGIGDSIMEINADGTCRTRVLSYSTATLFGATWQPGPGREAGPIAC